MTIRWSKLRFWVLGAAAAAALVAAGFFLIGGRLHSAQAQGQGTSSQPGQQTLQHVEQILAGKLGISVDKLNQALTDTRNQLLDEAVQSGKITAAQANAIKSKPLAGSLGLAAIGRGIPGPHGPRGLGGPGGFFGGSVVSSAAKVMNTDVKSVVQELGQGKSLAQIGQEHGVSLDALKSGILSDVKSSLQSAVSSGKLTQSQADSRYNQLSSNIDKLLSQTHQPRRGNGAQPTPTP